MYFFLFYIECFNRAARVEKQSVAYESTLYKYMFLDRGEVHSGETSSCNAFHMTDNNTCNIWNQ